MDKRCLALRCLMTPLRSEVCTCLLLLSCVNYSPVSSGYTDWEGCTVRRLVTDATAQLSAVTGDPSATVAAKQSSVVAVMFDWTNDAWRFVVADTVTSLSTRCAVSSSVNYSPSHGGYTDWEGSMARRLDYRCNRTVVSSRQVIQVYGCKAITSSQ